MWEQSSVKEGNDRGEQWGLYTQMLRQCYVLLSHNTTVLSYHKEVFTQDSVVFQCIAPIYSTLQMCYATKLELSHYITDV